MKNSVVAIMTSLAVVSVRALEIEYSATEPVEPGDWQIPDDGILVADLEITDPTIVDITDVDLHLTISGGAYFDLSSLFFYTDAGLPVVSLFPINSLSGSTLDIWFDDDATLSIADFNPLNAPGTRYRPLQPLTTFNGLPANVTWFLSIEDGQITVPPYITDGLDNRLTGWKLSITGNTSAVPDTLPGVVPAVSLFGLVAADAMRRRMKR